MKGVVFTEFLEMIEAKYSPAMVEDVIDAANLSSRGAYTAVGTYSHQELVAIVHALSGKTGVTTPDLLRSFGEHMFQTYLRVHNEFFTGLTSAFDLFGQVQGYIHREVKKLYPDARPPHFDIECHTPQRFTFVYRSPRPLGDFCEGMIIAALRHFGETVELRRTDLEMSPVTCIRFDLIKNGQ